MRKNFNKLIGKLKSNYSIKDTVGSCRAEERDFYLWVDKDCFSKAKLLMDIEKRRNERMSKKEEKQDTRIATYIDGAFPTSWEYRGIPKVSNFEEQTSKMRSMSSYFVMERSSEDWASMEFYKEVNEFVGGYYIDQGYTQHDYKILDYMHYVSFMSVRDDKEIGSFVIYKQSKNEVFTAIASNDLFFFDFICQRAFKAIKQEPLLEISYKYMTQHGIQSDKVLKSVGDYAETYDYYYPFIDTEMMAKNFLEGNENLLILTGLPGTGKTSFVKYLFKHINFMGNKDKYNATYVQDMRALKDDSFWSGMINGSVDLVVMDDLDDALKPRGRQEEIGDKGERVTTNTFVSKLLPISSGVFDLNTKIVITTNREVSEIDSALLRPGRCFDVLCFRYLTLEEAKGIWIDKYGQDESSFMRRFSGMDSISQAHLKSEFDRQMKSSGYIRESGVSIRETLIKNLRGDERKTEDYIL